MTTEVCPCECGNHAWFTLTKGYVCIVDAHLAPAFTCWSWHALLDNGNVYAARTVRSYCDGHIVDHKQYAHAIVLPLPSRLVVDHKNNNGLDNRRKNLRPLSSAANSHRQKKKANCSSSYKGVGRRGGGWFAYIQVQGKQRPLGMHETQEAAAAAYNAAAAEIYGASASLNAVEAA